MVTVLSWVVAGATLIDDNSILGSFHLASQPRSYRSFDDFMTELSLTFVALQLLVA